ncbi:MAG: hypothetical protein ACX93P_12200 [Roseovarius sp.]
MAPLLALRAAWLAQRGHLFAWAPVMVACGVGLYFALLVEPAPWMIGAAAAMAALLGVATRRAGAVGGRARSAGRSYGRGR